MRLEQLTYKMTQKSAKWMKSMKILNIGYGFTVLQTTVFYIKVSCDVLNKILH